MADWSLGEYELTAARLAPAADVAVDALAPRPGERVLDVGCGTGNAALVAARRGAAVVGVDPAERLLEVARRRAAEEGLEAEFTVGEGAALPVDDEAFDAAVSVFGVIFADAEPAAEELVRVVRPGGRIVLTTWVLDGPTPRVMDVVREALGAPPSAPRWSDPDFVRSLFAPHEVAVDYGEVAFDAPSARAYLDEHLEHHPLWVAMAPALRAQGKLDAVLAEAEAIFEASNEDPSAFRTTSRYHVATVKLRRRG